VWDPDGHGDIEQHNESAHSHINAGTGEPRIQNREGEACGGKSSARSDVAGSAKRQVGENGVGVDLSGEDFEDWRQRKEMLAQSNKSTSSPPFSQFYE
jgi:hypothetical protein